MSSRKTARRAKKAVHKGASTSRAHRRASNGAEERDGSPGRSLWTGAIAFGLVQIPVKMYPGESHEELAFHQLDRRDLGRIRYQRVNEVTGLKVDWGDIVKGYELPGGDWVTLDDEEIEAAHPEATHTIDIQDFVSRDEIEPVYFEKPYFLAPDGRNSRAYTVFRAVLEKKHLAAIALVVIRTRQRLVVVFPSGNGLVLETLRFAEELKSPRDVIPELPAKATATSKEIALAEQLVESLEGEWEPTKYKDTFKEEILKSIEVKAKTGKLPIARAKRPPSNVTNLVTLLQKSLAREKGAKETQSARRAKKRAA